MREVEWHYVSIAGTIWRSQQQGSLMLYERIIVELNYEMSKPVHALTKKTETTRGWAVLSLLYQALSTVLIPVPQR